MCLTFCRGNKQKSWGGEGDQRSAELRHAAALKNLNHTLTQIRKAGGTASAYHFEGGDNSCLRWTRRQGEWDVVVLLQVGRGPQVPLLGTVRTTTSFFEYGLDAT